MNYAEERETLFTSGGNISWSDSYGSLCGDSSNTGSRAITLSSYSTLGSTDITIAKKWNRSRCVSICEWVKTHTMGFYSVIKENEFMTFTRKINATGDHYVI